MNLDISPAGIEAAKAALAAACTDFEAASHNPANPQRDARTGPHAGAKFRVDCMNRQAGFAEASRLSAEHVGALTVVADAEEAFADLTRDMLRLLEAQK